MWRWTGGGTLWVIGVAGVVTVLLSYLILGYGPKGLFSARVEPGILAWSALPSAMLLAASLTRRNSIGTQRFVAAAAAVVAALIGGAICLELSGPYQSSRTGPGTGLLAYLAWVVGAAGATMVLLVAAGGAVWDWLRRE